MNRKLVWIEQPRFRGFGCSECAWVFNASGSPTGNSFDEMMRHFESQRDAPGDDPRTKRLQQQSHPSSWGKCRHESVGA
jgi:hypothetical protein